MDKCMNYCIIRYTGDCGQNFTIVYQLSPLSLSFLILWLSFFCLWVWLPLPCTDFSNSWSFGSKSLLFYNHHLKLILHLAIVLTMSLHWWHGWNCFLWPLKLIQIYIMHILVCSYSYCLKLFILKSTVLSAFIFCLFYVIYLSFVASGLHTNFPFFLVHASLFIA